MFRRIAGAIVLTIGKALKFKKEERVMEERVSQEIKKEEKMEAEYAKTEFVGIKSVTKEIYQGNTYYVVVTESGEIFGVDARKYPEIRTANEQNKVKYVIDDYKVNGLQKPFKLELK